MCFILNTVGNPYYGAIGINWYPLGALSQYTQDKSDPSWFSEDDIDQDKLKHMKNEIIYFIEIARQIALGNSCFNW